MNRTYIYTCNDCQHEWKDSRPEKYADAPIKFGCHSCRSKNITYIEKEQDKVDRIGAPIIGDPVKLGRTKTPEGFKDVLRKIKKNNQGSTINID